MLLARLTTSDMYSGGNRPLSDEMTLTNSFKSSTQGDCPDGAAVQNWRHRYNAWSRKTAQAEEQLSQRTGTAEPVLQTVGATAAEAHAL